MRSLGFLLVLPLLIDTSQVHAFDAWGFQSGMAEKQVMAAAQQQGYTARQGLKQVFPLNAIILGRKAANGSYRVGYAVGFCSGKLQWVSRNYEPNMGSLVNILAELTKQYGAPQAVAKLYAGEVGPYLLTFVFPPHSNDNAKVVVNPAANSGSTFSIQVTHGANVYCGL